MAHGDTVTNCDSVEDDGCSARLVYLLFDVFGDGIEMNARGLVVCDPESGRTSARDLYIAGDLAYGPKLLIHAVASGKRVARNIYESITKTLDAGTYCIGITENLDNEFNGYSLSIE